MKRSERVKEIIREIVKVTSSHEDWEIIDCWLAYRLLALQFEKGLMDEIDEYVQQAMRKNITK